MSKCKECGGTGTSYECIDGIPAYTVPCPLCSSVELENGDDCPTCNGTGDIEFKGITSTCWDCEGTGFVWWKGSIYE